MHPIDHFVVQRPSFPLLSLSPISIFPPSRENLSQVHLLPGAVTVEFKHYACAAEENDVRIFRDHRVHVSIPREKPELGISLIRCYNVFYARYPLDYLSNINKMILVGETKLPQRWKQGKFRKPLYARLKGGQ